MCISEDIDISPGPVLIPVYGCSAALCLFGVLAGDEVVSTLPSLYPPDDTMDWSQDIHLQISAGQATNCHIEEIIYYGC